MWGWGAQAVATVIAVMLLYPALEAPRSALPGYLAAGRAFPAYPEPAEHPDPIRPAATPAREEPPAPVVRVSADPGARTALIVGIDRARGTAPLPGSVTDAQNLQAALLAYGFAPQNITMLLNEQATRPAILSALRALAARTPTDGLAVFAAATHTRRARATNQLATAEGGRISATELGAHLAAVRSPAWIALPTCYAGGYAVRGIVGPGRVATFASSADRPSYQAGAAGSFLFVHMVRKAMLERRAPSSVEAAFAYARSELERNHPDHVPSMSDGVPGELVLGRAGTLPVTPRGSREGARPGWSAASDHPSASPAPAPTPRRRRGGVGVCGRFNYNC